jgi:3-(3-hydroxy-phenyl)propionate hydroxylase
MSRVFARFSYSRPADLDRSAPARRPVVIVGAGPVGLALAIDLGQRGVPVVLLDDSDRIGEGSRAICFSKKSLEIFARLGMAGPVLEKGVEWRRGKVFRGTEREPLYAFDLLPESGHRMPAFVNIQQFHVEKHLVDRASDVAGVDVRWLNRVTGVRPAADHVAVTVETPDGGYELEAEWLVACDGARSPVRDMLGLPFLGEVFEDRFLIADVRMTAPFPTERWFWFDPPFHDGQSALLHRQPDDIWRIDLQLSRDADTDHERRPEVVRPRIARMLGHEAFDLDWVSVYRFQCRRLERFVHGRVVFAGDAAHQVSPFGARGANSGLQDAENLAWKLAAVLAGQASAGLIDTYDTERSEAADVNILNSTRATDFLSPHSPAERLLRDAVLDLARHAGFAARMVNSGRLSVPSAYSASPLSTEDRAAFPAGPAPGAPVPDAPLRAPDGRPVFLGDVLGQGFALLASAEGLPPETPETVTRVAIGEGAGLFGDPEGHARHRFGLEPGVCYLLRPDRHVAARWRFPAAGDIGDALRRAHGS